MIREEFDVWRSTDDEWLLQVSHETGRLGFTNLFGDSTVETVAIGYAGDAAASAIGTEYVGNPDVVYDGLKQKDEATIIEQDLDYAAAGSVVRWSPNTDASADVE